MAGGSLTLEEFWMLSEDERCKRYKDLSDHDKFGVRQSMDPGCAGVPCNDCIHYRGFAKCDAFPDGISAEHIQAVMDDQRVVCAGNLGYEKKRD